MSIFFKTKLYGVIASMGSRQVDESTSNREKLQLTVVLSIFYNGSKVKLFLNFVVMRIQKNYMKNKSDAQFNEKKHILQLIKMIR